MKRNYNYNSAEYQQMNSNQRLFLLVILSICLLVAVGGFIGLCWYFFGPLGGKIALGGLVIALVFLTGWMVVMASVNSISNIYRDAANTIIDFQAADDRGEALRHMASVVKSGNQLDKTVLSMAGKLAKEQTRALVDHRTAVTDQSEQDTIESEWWNLPTFEDAQ